MKTKICNECRVEQEIQYFNTRKLKSGNIGYRSICKSCKKMQVLEWRKSHKQHTAKWHRTKNLKRYGLTDQDYGKMLTAQNNCCAICDRHESTFSNKLAVDHCHVTGKVRALLCTRCNTAIGSLSSPELLNKAKEYLESYA